MSDKIVAFFKKAMEDMRQDAKAQHEVDRANFAAAKAESSAQWEEAKALGRPNTCKQAMKRQQAQQLAAAQARMDEAHARIRAARR